MNAGQEIRRGDIANLLGAEFKRIRASQRLSQRELSVQAGIPRTVIARLETGQYCPGFIVFMRMCRALQVWPSSVVKVLDREGL